MSRILIQAALLSTFAGAVSGQQIPPAFTRWQAEPLPVSTARLHQGDYRYEGLIFGGVALGALGAYVGSQISDACPLEAGSQCSPPVILREASQNAATIPDSVRLRVGYQHWKGAAIGTGVGAVLGGALALVGGAGCADCTITTWDRARAALLVTGGGAVLGFLAGLASPRYAWVQHADAGEVGSDPKQE